MLAASRAAVPRWAHLRGCPGVSVLRPLSVSSDEDAPFLPLSHHRDRPLLQETETQVLPPGHGDTHKLILQTRGDLRLVMALCPLICQPLHTLAGGEHWKLGALGSERKEWFPSCPVRLRTARTLLKR